MWGTQKREQFTFEVGTRRGSEESLHDRLLAALTGEFGEAVINSRFAKIVPDLCLRLPGTDRFGVVELKIGDPSLPLPSSTTTQIIRLVQGMDPEQSGARPTPVVVTNYLVDENQKKDLEANNIKLVRLTSNPTAKAVAEQVKLALNA